MPIDPSFKPGIWTCVISTSVCSCYPSIYVKRPWVALKGLQIYPQKRTGKSHEKKSVRDHTSECLPRLTKHRRTPY